MTSIATRSSNGSRRLTSRVLLPFLWVALTVAMFFAARDVPWASVLLQLKLVRVPWVIAALVANALVLTVWAAEWRILAPRAHVVRYASMFEVVAVTAAVLNSIPFFAGEATGIAMLVARAGLPRGVALSVLAMDQLVNGLVKIVVLGLAAVYLPLPVWLRAGVVALVVGVTALLVLLVPLAHRWASARDRVLVKTTRGRRLLATLLSLGEHLEAIRETRRVSRVVALALAKKTVELLAVLSVQIAFGVQPSVPAGLLVLAALAIATMIPVSPANLGVYEATVFAAYRFVGVPVDMAIGLALVQHVCVLMPMLATGYLTTTLRQFAPKVATP